jgi:hypothetical protein
MFLSALCRCRGNQSAAGDFRPADAGHDGEAGGWPVFASGAGLNENSRFRQSIARMRIDRDEVCPPAIRVTSMRWRCSRESSL